MNKQELIKKLEGFNKKIESCKDDKKAVEMQQRLLNELMSLLNNENFIKELIEESQNVEKN